MGNEGSKGKYSKMDGLQRQPSSNDPQDSQTQQNGNLPKKTTPSNGIQQQKATPTTTVPDSESDSDHVHQERALDKLKNGVFGAVKANSKYEVIPTNEGGAN
uniref:Uncharacterized protein n=1 Tax=Clytia hemisphaerica TaxID=252671 RepID=A0A7M5XJ23_9CNID|eukprot:TCONS_00072612-protein